MQKGGGEFWKWAFSDAATEELRSLIMTCWDPIGVSVFPEAADEYNAYLPMIFAALGSGRDAQWLQERLSEVRTDTMGLPPDPDADAEAARRILEWYGERRSEG